VDFPGRVLPHREPILSKEVFFCLHPMVCRPPLRSLEEWLVWSLKRWSPVEVKAYLEYFVLVRLLEVGFFRKFSLLRPSVRFSSIRPPSRIEAFLIPFRRSSVFENSPLGLLIPEPLSLENLFEGSRTPTRLAPSLCPFLSLLPEGQRPPFPPRMMLCPPLCGRFRAGVSFLASFLQHQVAALVDEACSLAFSLSSSRLPPPPVQRSVEAPGRPGWSLTSLCVSIHPFFQRVGSAFHRDLL